MRQRILSFLCMAALLFGLTTSAAASGLICFTAVNINVLPLTSDTMPVWSGIRAELQYVPYTVFDDATTGAGLGLYSTYSRSSNTVTIYSLYKMLVFDLQAGTCRDGDSQMFYSSKAIIRNGRPYVPVALIRDVFGLSVTNLITDYGATLLRIKNSDAMDDATFIDAADNILSSRLREYRQSQNPITPTTPSQTAPPATNPPPELPPPIILPETHSTAPAYLAIHCQTGEGLEEIISSLDQAGYKALFFFQPELLAQQDDLVRRLLGSGHLVGLATAGQSLEESRTQLAHASRLLRAIAHTRTSLVLSPAAQRQALEEEGWICWQETTSAVTEGEFRAQDYAKAAIQSIPATNHALYFTFPDGQSIADGFDDLLNLLVSRNFIVAIPLEISL